MIADLKKTVEISTRIYKTTLGYFVEATLDGELLCMGGPMSDLPAGG